MASDKRRDLRAYRARVTSLKRRTKAHNDPCWLCGEPFDWSLHPSHGRAFTADHVVPLAQGGRILGELRPAHRACNARRGDARREQGLPTTRRW